MRFFLLAIFLVCSATQSYALLTNSKHDLSALGGEPCAYCHSVHNSVGGIGRPAYMSSTLPSISDIYDSSTLDVANTATVTSVENSDAPLCLTCHDGAWVLTKSGSSAEFMAIQTKMYPSYPGTPMDQQNLNIGSDLRNDHPVGFVYPTNIGTFDSELKYPTDLHVHVTFGPNKNEMWCSTCHNAHGGVAVPLLNMSNSGSALCLECHIK